MAQGPWRESSQGRGGSPTEPQHNVTPQACTPPIFSLPSLASRQESKNFPTTEPPAQWVWAVSNPQHLAFMQPLQHQHPNGCCQPVAWGWWWRQCICSLAQHREHPPSSQSIFWGAQGGREELEEELPCTDQSQGQSSGWFEQLTHQEPGRGSTAGAQPHCCCSLWWFLRAEPHIPSYFPACFYHTRGATGFPVPPTSARTHRSCMGEGGWDSEEALGKCGWTWCSGLPWGLAPPFQPGPSPAPGLVTAREASLQSPVALWCLQEHQQDLQHVCASLPRHLILLLVREGIFSLPESTQGEHLAVCLCTHTSAKSQCAPWGRNGDLWTRDVSNLDNASSHSLLHSSFPICQGCHVLS